MNMFDARTSTSGRSSPYYRSPMSSSGGFWSAFTRSPMSSFGGAQDNASQARQTTITFTLAVIACLLILIQSFQESTSRHSKGTGHHWGNGEVTRDAALEQRLLQKEQELESLRVQLQATVSSNAGKEGSMQAHEASIKLLQERIEKERMARTKAQFVLSERQQAASKCSSDVSLLERELELCTQEVTGVRGKAQQAAQQQAQQEMVNRSRTSKA